MCTIQLGADDPANDGYFVPAGAFHETFWFRGHGIEGLTYVEKNHDPHHSECQSRPLPVRDRGDFESSLMMQGVGLTAGAFLLLPLRSTILPCNLEYWHG